MYAVSPALSPLAAPAAARKRGAMDLIARDIACRRGGRRLFAPVDLDLPGGRALVLRGPNGAGKTTLLRALAGLGAAPDGSVTLGGRPLAAQEGQVAYAGHRDAVKPGLTVAANIRFWAALHGRPGATEAALAHFALGPMAGLLAGRLSAGQVRRLGLARLMVTGAALWLLDEPTVSLDAASVGALGAMLAAHLAGGGLAVIATHQDLPLQAATLHLSPAPAEAARAADPFLAEAGA